mmetsp:Transcript_26186/g.42373  ORF Transcript_26186/g.42373 Transcript_26186/m.42373 type:complete len:225 (+) Transcript_26186:5853-6527(+)
MHWAQIAARTIHTCFFLTSSALEHRARSADEVSAEEPTWPMISCNVISSLLSTSNTQAISAAGPSTSLQTLTAASIACFWKGKSEVSTHGADFFPFPFLPVFFSGVNGKNSNNNNSASTMFCCSEKCNLPTNWMLFVTIELYLFCQEFIAALTDESILDVCFAEIPSCLPSNTTSANSSAASTTEAFSSWIRSRSTSIPTVSTELTFDFANSTNARSRTVAFGW